MENIKIYERLGMYFCARKIYKGIHFRGVFKSQLGKPKLITRSFQNTLDKSIIFSF